MAKAPKSPKATKAAPVKRRKTAAERHETPFKINVTVADYDLFTAAATAEGLPATVWARGVLRKEARRITGAGH